MNEKNFAGQLEALSSADGQAVVDGRLPRYSLFVDGGEVVAVPPGSPARGLLDCQVLLYQAPERGAGRQL